MPACVWNCRQAGSPRNTQGCVCCEGCNHDAEWDLEQLLEALEVAVMCIHQLKQVPYAGVENKCDVQSKAGTSIAYEGLVGWRSKHRV